MLDLTAKLRSSWNRLISLFAHLILSFSLLSVFFAESSSITLVLSITVLMTLHQNKKNSLN